MFEIGSTLRDARVRRGISLQQAEEDTKIRVKYIQAMENEDFDVLPGGTYVKGFLRTYSDYLDLDYQVVLDEFNDRFGSGDHREHLIQPPKTARTKQPRSKRQNYVFVAVLAVAIILVLAYLGWGNSSKQTPTLVTTSGMETTTGTASTPAAIPAPPPADPVQQPPTTPTGTGTTRTTSGDTIDSIAFQSTKSDNWVGVYKDASLSDQIWAGTLHPGQSKQLSASDLGGLKTVYIQVGSASGLGTQVNGQPQDVQGQKTYKVTSAGAKPAGS